MSQRAPARLTVTVTDIGAKVIGAFELDQDAQVSHLRHRLQQSSNVPLYDQHLICGNKVLTDDMSLGSLTTLGQSEFLQITLLRAPKPCALTAGSEGNFMLWDLDTGHCCRFLPFSTSVLCLKVDWLARIALSGHTDSCLRLWDLDRGFCLREMPLTNSFVSLRSVDFDWQMKVAVSSSLAYGCSMIGSPVQPLGLWDLAAGGYIRGFLTESMHAACISADWSRCQLLAAGDALELFDIDLGQRLWCLRSWQWSGRRRWRSHAPVIESKRGTWSLKNAPRSSNIMVKYISSRWTGQETDVEPQAAHRSPAHSAIPWRMRMPCPRYLWRRLVQLDVGPSGLAAGSKGVDHINAFPVCVAECVQIRVPLCLSVS
ncbi:unnamed protein product [Durusdinium trenchii]|uniref:Ubiquitin-like domain-containing protein n=1 Tax=Durusdinium trenchii TaxID=1381693 RepID=A0ABP0L7L3_9DINO